MLASLLLAVVPPVPVPVDQAFRTVGNWYVETGGRTCVVSRYLAGPDGRASKATVGFLPSLDGKRLDIFIKTAATSDIVQNGGVNATFGSTGPTSTGYFSSGRLRDHQTRLYTIALADPAGTQVLTATKVQLSLETHEKVPSSYQITVDYGSMARVRAALTECQAKVIDSLKLAPENLNPATPATFRSNPQRSFGSMVYPATAIASGSTGPNTLMLLIQADGRVGDCFPIVSAGIDLDEAGCRTARRVSFKPALNAQGKPIVSLFRFNISWAILTP